MKKLIQILVLIFITTGLSAQKTEIKFKLRFGLVTGGEAKLVINDTTYEGKPAISYYFSGKTVGLPDKLFDIHDVYHTIVDAKTHLPLKSIRDVSEKKYTSYNEVRYFHDNDSIYSLKSGGRKVPKNLLDILSVFFYATNHDNIDNLGQGSFITYQSLNNDKISPITIRYMGEERIKTKLGRFDTFILVPQLDKGKVLLSSDGLKMNIHKKYLVPVNIEFQLLLGSLQAEIVEYKINGKRINL